MAEDQETTDNAEGVKAKSKKLLMIYGGGLLVLIIAIGVGAYFFLGEKEVDVVPLEEQAVEEEIIEEEEEVKIKKVKIKKVNIYNLEPFFL
ncbi:uncharacterized protein METZ01_LOCUS296576, partial [marine metagenome]